MKMTDILHRYYGDFDLINEKWNEDYESILIKPKDNQEYKICRLAWKKDQDNKNIPYTDRDLGDELVICRYRRLSLRFIYNSQRGGY